MCIILHNDIMYNSNQWYTIIIQQSQSFYLQPATHSGHEIIPQGPGWLRSLRCPEREGLDGGTPARGAGWCSTPTRNSAGQQLMEGLGMAKACSCFSTFLFINIYKHTCIKGLIDSLDLEWKKLLTLPPVSLSLRQKPLPWHRMRKECERLIRFTTPRAFHFWYFCCLYMVVPPTFLIRQRIHRCFRVPFAFELPFGLTSSDQLGTLFWPKNAGNRGQQAYAGICGHPALLARCKAHVDNRVLDIQREKDLMEVPAKLFACACETRPVAQARLRGELDDAQHQRQFQEAFLP